MIGANAWGLLLLGQDRDSYSLRRIIEEANGLGLYPVLVHFSEIELLIHKRVEVLRRGGECLDHIRAVILDSPGPYTVLRNFLVSHFTSSGIYVLNARSFLTWPTLGKLTQAYHLHRAGISIIPTRLFGDSSRLVVATRDWTTPLVAKAVDGAGGKGTWEVGSERELRVGPLRYHAAYHLLIQPRICVPKEYRVVVLGDRLLGGVCKTPAPGEFRANLEQGATFEKVSLPSMVKEASIRSCQVLRCDFAGVDVLYEKDDSNERCWVLEVNRFLGFEGFEHATKINVALSLLIWIAESLGSTLHGKARAQSLRRY
jgi:ribosomal protein S6--L-glutamate ligase